MRLDCFENFIGIKGACDNPKSNLWWHELPKISLKKAAKLADGQRANTGVKLLRQFEQTAVKRVINDLKIAISPYYQFNSIIGDVTVTDSGTYKWNGNEDNWYSVTYKKYTDDKFQETCIPYIGLTVDRSISKEIFIEDETGRQSIEVSLKKGYNKVKLDIETTSCWIRIFFNPIGVNIGEKRECSCSCEKSCDKCNYNFGCGALWTERSNDGLCWDYCANLFGFDICVQCRCSIESLACYFKKDLDYSIFYMAGIVAMEEHLYSDDVSPCFRNNKEDYEDILKALGGDKKMVFGQEVKKMGKYQETLLGSVETIKNQLRNLKTPCLSCNSGKVVAGF